MLTSRCSIPPPCSIDSTYREPALPPAGIRYVIVNGVPVVSKRTTVEGVAPAGLFERRRAAVTNASWGRKGALTA
jgi:N-acyl-D-aspartate/D-glutamate deacylase